MRMDCLGDVMPLVHVLLKREKDEETYRKMFRQVRRVRITNCLFFVLTDYCC